MHRSWTLLTTTLTTGALACGLALAEPARKAPTVTRQQTFLTPAEQRCSQLGAFAYTIAQARDAGTSLTETLARWRAAGRTRPITPDLGARYTEAIRDIFAATVLSPATIRQLMEAGCLDTLAPRTPQTSKGDWR